MSGSQDRSDHASAYSWENILDTSSPRNDANSEGALLEMSSGECSDCSNEGKSNCPSCRPITARHAAELARMKAEARRVATTSPAPRPTLDMALTLDAIVETYSREDA